MIAWIAAAVAVFYSLWAIALALLFVAHLQIPTDRPSARATLILPATGHLPGFEDLLTALTAQSLTPYRLIIAVESREDPAYARVAGIAGQYAQLNITLVVAGLSSLRSQKCTNLLAALTRLDADDAYIVLLDADIRPQPWWLATLVAPLVAGRADVVNGYRWPVPTMLSPGTVLAAAIDRAIAVLPRATQAKPIWGRFPRPHSSRARKSRFTEHDRADPGASDQHTQPSFRSAVAYRQILCPIRPLTPLDGSLGDHWRFGRRQYQLIRLYRRRAMAVCRFRRHHRPGRPHRVAVHCGFLGCRPRGNPCGCRPWVRLLPRSGWGSAES